MSERREARGAFICNVEDERVALLRSSLPPRQATRTSMQPWMKNDIERTNALHDALDSLADDLYEPHQSTNPKEEG